MSLFESYDSEVKAALNPEDVYDKVDGFPETVIVTFKKAIVDLVLENFECEILHGNKQRLSDFGDVQLRLDNGELPRDQGPRFRWN